MAEYYQTSETATKDYLKTNWYKASYSRVKDAVIDAMKKMGYEVTNINDDYGELFVVGTNFEVTFTIFQMTVSETSVDMYFIPKMIFDLGKSKKIITEIYAEIAKRVPFIGLALHK